MWPTFYIPSVISAGGGIDPGLDYLCGIATSVAGVNVVPSPTQIADGDVQLVLISYATETGLTLPTFAGSGIWREYFSYARVPTTDTLGWGDGPQRAFWRIYDSADPPFTATQTTGGKLAYMTLTLTNTNLSDPIFFAYNRRHTIKQAGPNLDGHAQYLRASAPGDIFLIHSAGRNGMFSANEPDVSGAEPDAEFACTNDVGSNYGGHTLAATQAGRHVATNLLRYSHTADSAAWTRVNVTVNSSGVSYAGGSAKGNAALYQTSANAKHYIEQSVDLEAGKTYVFAVRGSATTNFTNPINRVWLTYEKPDTTEHGAGFSVGGPTTDIATPIQSLTGSTEVVVGGAGNPSVSFTGGSNLYEIYGGTYSILIHADVTGTYKLRIHLRGGNTDANTAQAGNTSGVFHLAATVLQEGPTVAQMANFLETGASAITSSDYELLAPWKADEGVLATAGWALTTFRRGGALARPVCTLFSHGRGIRHDVDDNSVLDTRLLDQPSILGHESITSSHVVYEFLAGKKFYFEVAVVSFGTGSTDISYCIGVAPTEAHNNWYNNSATPTGLAGNYAGQYVYRSTGVTRNNGAAGSSVASWQAGDHIGCGIDFTAGEISFYRNGTLQATHAIASSQQKHALWNALLGVFSEYAADKQARFTWNFRGPFGGRKPSGFVAWDFDNELT